MDVAFGEGVFFVGNFSFRIHARRLLPRTLDLEADGFIADSRTRKCDGQTVYVLRYNCMIGLGIQQNLSQGRSRIPKIEVSAS